jgi:hypothetical protein
MVAAILKVDEGGGCGICHVVVMLRLIRRWARHIAYGSWRAGGCLWCGSWRRVGGGRYSEVRPWCIYLICHGEGSQFRFSFLAAPFLCYSSCSEGIVVLNAGLHRACLNAITLGDRSRRLCAIFGSDCAAILWLSTA